MLLLADTQFVETTGVWIIKSLVIFAFVLTVVPMLLLLERKLLGRFQNRYGPNRVGPYGLLQPLADVLKLISKEQFYPSTGVPGLMALAPAIMIVTALASMAIIPFGNVEEGFGSKFGLYGIDVNIGILYAFAFGSLAFYGLMLGGWASGSKYSFLGAMRSAAQLISYEVSLGLSLIGVVMMAGSLSLVDIVNAQDGVWFVLPQFVGFLIFTVAGFAETNRPPFDLPEADAELVGGYNTEFGGMRFGSFFMAEYINMLVIAGIAAAMFFGGWMGPGPRALDPLWMVLKMLAVVVFFIWIRATMPRLRYDQLMSFGWKILLPLATLNLLVTAVLVALDMSYRPDKDVIAVQRGPDAGGLGGVVRTFGETLRGLKTTFGRLVEGPVTIQYPEEKTPVYPRFRGRHKLHRFEDIGAREVRRLLAVRGRLSGRLHPGRGGGEHTGPSRLGRRALRGGVRDQHDPLHLLRLLRGRVPVRRDHARSRLRDVGLQQVGPHLHEGNAVGGPDRADTLEAGG